MLHFINIDPIANMFLLVCTFIPSCNVVRQIRGVTLKNKFAIRKFYVFSFVFKKPCKIQVIFVNFLEIWLIAPQYCADLRSNKALIPVYICTEFYGSDTKKWNEIDFQNRKFIKISLNINIFTFNTHKMLCTC